MHKETTITAVLQELVCQRCKKGVYRYAGWEHYPRSNSHKYIMKCIKCEDSFRALHPHPVIKYKGRVFVLQDPSPMSELELGAWTSPPPAGPRRE